jgi:hypothetical protein
MGHLHFSMAETASVLYALSMTIRLSTTRLSLAISVLAAASLAGPASRVLPEGKQPDDVRLQPPKDLDGYFPFKPPASKADWEKRAQRVRRQILVSQGPPPMLTPLTSISTTNTGICLCS